jgi:hypothetical protein
MDMLICKASVDEFLYHWFDFTVNNLSHFLLIISLLVSQMVGVSVAEF